MIASKIVLLILPILLIIVNAEEDSAPDLWLEQQICDSMAYCWRNMNIGDEASLCDRTTNATACGSCFSVAEDMESFGCYDVQADGTCPAESYLLHCADPEDVVPTMQLRATDVEDTQKFYQTHWFIAAVAIAALALILIPAIALVLRSLRRRNTDDSEEPVVTPVVDTPLPEATPASEEPSDENNIC